MDISVQTDFLEQDQKRKMLKNRWLFTWSSQIWTKSSLDQNRYFRVISRTVRTVDNIIFIIEVLEQGPDRLRMNPIMVQDAQDDHLDSERPLLVSDLSWIHLWNIWVGGPDLVLAWFRAIFEDVWAVFWPFWTQSLCQLSTLVHSWTILELEWEV